jgi:hypothetical protein
VKHPELYEDDEEEEVEEEVDGVAVPTPSRFDPEEFEEREDEDESLSDVDITYPLVPEDPDKGDLVFAWAHITWEESEGELIYHIVEPELNSNTEKILEKIKDILERSFDVDFTGLETEEAEEYLEEKIDKIVDKYNISLSDKQRQIIRYYAKRDFAGLGKLQPLMNDTEVEDISCDGNNIPVYAYHRNP